jgi:predicted outer membrane protein
MLDLAMKTQSPSPCRIAFRPTSSLALLVGFSAMAIAAPAARPLQGQPPGEQPSTPEAPLPSRPAEDFQSQAPGAPQKPSRASVRVLVEMAALGTESARLSQFATQRAAHAEVRDFAGQVTQASQALVEEIDRLAAAKNVSLRPDAAHVGPDDREAGAAFDEDYLRRTRRLHADAIATLEEYTGGGEKDPHIAAMAEQHLPGLHRQLRQAEDLDEQVSRNPSPRPDDLIAGEPSSANSLRHPPVILALHEESVD